MVAILMWTRLVNEEGVEELFLAEDLKRRKRSPLKEHPHPPIRTLLDNTHLSIHGRIALPPK